MIRSSASHRILKTSLRLFSTTSSNLINFEITDLQKGIVDLTRNIVKEFVIPKAAEHDKGSIFPHELIKKCWEAGILNPLIAEEFGGPSLGVIEASLVAEELGYGCAGMGIPIVASSIAQIAIIMGGNKEQKKKYLGRLSEFPYITSACITEPGNGSDAAAGRTTAIKKGNEYIISGQKMWITNASKSNWFYLLARTSLDKSVAPQKSFGGFIIEADTPGITFCKKDSMLGQRASDTRRITFNEVIVPAENLVGKEGDGFKLTMGVFEKSRPPLSALGNGVAQRCLDEATKYALERKAFGTQIFNFQAISHMLADMAISVENTRNAILRSAWETDRQPGNPYWSAIGKALAGESSTQSSSNAIQIFGGNGLNASYPIEKMSRDSKIFQIYEGTTQIQKLIISREMANRMKNRGTCRSN